MFIPVLSDIVNKKKFDWYVDSVNGNDANSGKSPGQAFATIAALEAVTIAAGNRIGLARGSTWHEQLDITVNNVTIKAYGGGNDPVLDASDVVAAGSWSKTVGLTNVYEASVNSNIAASKTWVNVWENDAFLVRVADTATCDTTPGSYVPSADTGAGGPITVYIHPNGSTDPTSDGKTYEVTVRQYGLNARSATGSIVTSIETKRNLHEDGSTVSGRQSVFIDCTFSDGSKHNALLGDGSTVTNCIFSGAYYTTPYTLIVWNEDTPAGLGISATGCTFSIPTYNANSGGILCHKNTSGSFGVLVIQGCTFTNLNLAISQVDVTAVTASGNTFTNCFTAYRANVACVHTLSNNTVSCTGVASAFAVHTNVAGATIAITGDGYTIDNSGGGIRILHNNTILNLTNTTITLSSADAADGCVLFNTGLSGLVFTMNGSTLVIVNAAGNNLRGLTAPTYTGDNNNFNRAGGINNRWGASTYTTIADWRTATGQDANSTVG